MGRKKIYFRADAGQSIGYGHFIRSLALADMLKDDFDCTLFTRTPTEYQKKEAEGVCPLVALPADDSRFDLFLDLLQGDETVVLDNYFFTSEYQLEIKRKGCVLVCIDDMHDRHFYADVIINHCIDSCLGYDAEPYSKFFLGAGWALLRAPFLKENKFRNDKNHWVVTFGGSDPGNVTCKYLSLIKGLCPDARISVMVGDGYAYQDDLRAFGDVEVHRKLTAGQVSELFGSAGNVICSASSVCYEALACGCNVYAGCYVDNQVDFYNTLVSRGLIRPLGNLLEDNGPIAFGESGAHIRFSGTAGRFRLLFGALGLDAVRYQDMTEEQSHKTWECRNRDDIRRWMNDPEAFSFESHCRFVDGLRANPSKMYYAFFDGDRFVGSYDFVDIADGVEAERGLFVNPDFQGRHIASMMEAYMDGEIVKRGVKRLYAEVLKSNDRSYGYHLHAGYRVYKEDDKYYYLERHL